MELITHLAGRVRANTRRWYWQARYAYYDTPYGLQLRIGGVIIALIVTVALGATSVLQLTQSPAPGQGQHAAIVAIVALVVAIVAAILAVVLAPKPKAKKPRGADAPTTQDGQSALDIFGSAWIDDSFILAWKQMGTIPIKGKAK